MTAVAKKRLQTDILIVGAGPVGLTSSLFLSRFKIPHIVVERSTSPSVHPSAHVINTRTMEVWREVNDFEHKVHRNVKPFSDWRYFTYCRHLVGSENLVGATDHFAPSVEEKLLKLRADSVTRLTNYPQNRLCNLLRADIPSEYCELREGCDFDQIVSNSTTDSQVVSSVFDNVNEEELEITSKYVIGCDGTHSRVRHSLDIGTTGKENIQEFLNVHFSSKKLGEYMSNNRGLIHFIFNADSFMSVMITHDADEGEYIMHIPMQPPLQRYEEFTDDFVKQHIMKAAFAPGSNLLSNEDITIHSRKRWFMTAYIADKIRKENVFLAGDSCHAFPPTGGFGLNTGVQDAHNLLWKLAFLTKNQISDPDVVENTLEAYQRERIDTISKNTAFGYRNFMTALNSDKAFGINKRQAEAFVGVLQSAPALVSSLFGGVANQIAMRAAQTSMKCTSILATQLAFDASRSLPLFFQEQDLGFSYRDGLLQEPQEYLPEQATNDFKASLAKTDANCPVWFDQQSYTPELEMGHLMPHGFVWVPEALQQFMNTEEYSTRDLPSLLWRYAESTSNTKKPYLYIMYSGDKWKQALSSYSNQLDLVVESSDEANIYGNTIKVQLEDEFESRVRVDGKDWISVMRSDGHIYWCHKDQNIDEAGCQRLLTEQLQIDDLISKKMLQEF